MDDFFGKLDDILYAPVKLITDYLGEPLNAIHNKRERENEERRAELEEKRKKTDAKIAKEQAEFLAEIERQKQSQLAQQEVEQIKLNAQIEKDKAEYEAGLKMQHMNEQARLAEEAKENDTRLQMEMIKFNAEMDVIIAQQEEERRDRLVESIKRYQLDLANAMKDIVENIGMMSLELHKKAYDLVEEKTRSYKAIQDDAKKQSLLEIKEVKDEFMEDDPETYRMLVNTIMEERRSIIDSADQFILGLSEDIKRINQTTTDIIKMGMENINNNTTSMAAALPEGTMNHTYLSLTEHDDNIIDVTDINKQ